MPEQQPIPFDEKTAAEILNAETTPVRDLAFGEGHRLTTNSGQALEVFPGAARLSGQDFTVTVTGQPLLPDTGDDWVRFRSSKDGLTSSLALRQSGDVLFTRSAPRPVEQAEDTQDTQETQASAVSSTGTEPAAQPERGEPVEFTGRIGRTPKPSTREGKTTFKLAIAEHRQTDDGQEKTIWHEVWTADKISPQIAEQVDAHTLDQGTQVFVKGFRHERKPVGKQRQGKPFVRAFLLNPVKGQGVKQ
jgi:hypothetical protein